MDRRAYIGNIGLLLLSSAAVMSTLDWCVSVCFDSCGHWTSIPWNHQHQLLVMLQARNATSCSNHRPQSLQMNHSMIQIQVRNLTGQKFSWDAQWIFQDGRSLQYSTPSPAQHWVHHQKSPNLHQSKKVCLQHTESSLKNVPKQVTAVVCQNSGTVRQGGQVMWRCADSDVGRRSVWRRKGSGRCLLSRLESEC